jgi:hypothetical protein
MLPGPFAYAERWDETNNKYVGLKISAALDAHIVFDSEALIVRPEDAERQQQTEPAIPQSDDDPSSPDKTVDGAISPAGQDSQSPTDTVRSPTRFQGAVMISAERPAREIHQVVEAIIEQLTTLPDASVTIRLEIDAEVPSGLDRSKVRTLLENANTLGFVDKLVK